jgi:hypothetical protein
MECVSYDVQENKGRTAEFAAPICWTLCQCRVELCFVEIAQMRSRRLYCSGFGGSQGRDCGAIFFVPASKGLILQVMDPAFFAGQDVHKLLPN